MVVQVCNLNTTEVKAGRSKVKTSLGYIYGDPVSLCVRVGFNCLVQILALAFVGYFSLGSLNLLVSVLSLSSHKWAWLCEVLAGR